MKRLLAIMLLAFASTPSIEADQEGPVLLAKGKEYTIHVFNGAVQGKLPHQRIVQPGIVILHTDTQTGQASWMFQTGIYEIPKVRISYTVSRLLGLLQTDTHIVAVTYTAGRIFDRPPSAPPPDKGDYRLSVFEKKSGRKKFYVEILSSPTRPERVPDETTELGIIQKTDDGFVVMGASFVVLEDGSIKQKGSQPLAGGDGKPAPQP